MISSTLRLENRGGKRRGMPRLGFAEVDVVVMEQRSKHSHQHSRRRRKGGSKGGKKEDMEEKKKNKTETSSVVYVPNCNGSNKEDKKDCGSNTSSFFSSGSGSGSGSGNGSLFSTSASASCSAERSSFGSYHDSLFPHLSHLAGRGRCGSGGQDPDPERRRASFDISINTTQHCSREADQDIKGSKGGEEEDDRIELTVLDPAKHFFSLALRECQNRRHRSEGISLLAVAKRQQKRRPASIDFNSHMSDTFISSPRSVVAGVGSKKTSAISVHNRSGMFPSPGTPNYRHGGGVASGSYQKGWSSERVPLPANAGRKFGSSAALLPLGTGGKTLPSKWEDAEKWICSPVSSEGVGIRQSALPPHHRRPKSKSGPLGTQGVIGGCYSLGTSPSVPGFDGGRIPNFMVNSPFMAGVLMAGRGCRADDNGDRRESDVVCGKGGRSNSAQSDHSMVRSASVHGWSDLLMESSSSLPSSQDEKLDSSKNGCATVSSVVLTKDMATQMSPEGSTHSSSIDCPQSSSPPRTSHTIGELRNHLPKVEVRDVQIDDRVTVTRWSKKHIARGLDKSSTNTVQCKKKSMEAQSSGWEVTHTAKCISRSTREEAKITAWENLQKAKAEAAIRKLEMKIEKTRSSSMDKILNKLRSAQSKAQEMRNAVNAKHNHQVSTTTKRASIFRKAGRIASFSSCFSCRTF